MADLTLLPTPTQLSAATGTRVLLTTAPFAEHAARQTWATHSQWPAEWITTAGKPAAGAVVFALRVEVPTARTVRIHVTAHEGYLLTLDGRPLGRGPERGSSERVESRIFEELV